MGQRLKFAERRAVPVARAENDRNDASASIFVTCKGSLAFNLVAVLGLNEVGAYEQQNNLCAVESDVDSIPPLISSGNLPVMPLQDLPVSLVNDQLPPDFVHQSFICMSIREEDFDHRVYPSKLPTLRSGITAD
jgi:hypothetical protein